jgi:phage gpG-like protein
MSEGYRISASGTDRLAAKFEKFGGSLEKTLERELHRAGALVQRGAKINVTNVVLRRRSGLLGASITNVIGRSAGKIAAFVGTDVVYGRTHEFGATIANGFGRGIRIVVPKRPWLSRAMEENREKIYAMFGDGITAELKRHQL